MRISMLAAMLIAVPAGAFAQMPAATATAPAHYTTSTTDIGTLLDDPAAKAIIEKNIPGMTTNDQIDMARAMTLKDIQQYSPDKVTDPVLAKMDAEFAKIPAKAPAAK